MFDIVSGFVRAVVKTVLLSLVLYFFTGILLTVAEAGHVYETFFSYRLKSIDLPVWFVGMFILMALNGYWITKIAFLGGSAMFDGDQASLNVPVNPAKLFGANLAFICLFFLVFFIIRAQGW